jgi:glycine cleavage system H protein
MQHQQYSDELMYSHRHLWVRLDEDEQVADVGMTDALQEELPEILGIDMPMVGDELEMDTECLHLHLPDGTIYDLFAPLTGRVVEINRDVLDRPQLLHLAPMTNWMFRMEYDEPDEVEMLLEATRYGRYVDSL